MFYKLHRQMTCFCTFITGTILIALSCTCLFFAESNMKRNSYTSFLKELSVVITHLQSENSISHQWLNQLQGNSHFRIYLYDNGNELYYQSLYHKTSFSINSDENLLLEKIKTTAHTSYQLDIFSDTSNLQPIHEEFSIKDEDGNAYYTSAGILPKANGNLSFIILFPLDNQKSQIFSLRCFILFADILTIILLFTFSWFFTGKMLFPLEESKKKQNQFVASASHELRSPLTVMLSALEASKKAELPEERSRFENLIQEEGLRMQNLISQMLLLANSDSKNFQLHKTFCQPDSILLNVYEKYEFLAKKQQISLKLSLPDEIFPDCNCDFERMIQVFSILLDNALSYTPQNGSITLALNKTPSSEKLLFSVADTGCGIPDKDKKLVFERFYRLESSHTEKEHFGLGLCIAKEIITAHKGNIWIENNPEGGAIFIVELPI